MNTTDLALSRRGLLMGSGALVVAFSVADAGKVLAQVAGADTKPPLLPTEMDSWIAIGADGKVTIFFGKIDGGQGTDVGVAQMVAEELDVPVAHTSVVMGDTARTLNQGGASGSNGVHLGGVALRYAAAEARRILVTRAAMHWGVAPETLTVTDGVIKGGGHSISYAELIGGHYFHAKIGWNGKYGNRLELKGKAKPKDPSTYKIVGRPAPRFDVKGKVYAKAPYVTDIKVDGMLHGRMIRPAEAGAVPVTVDETSIASIPGARVVHRKDFIGVVAPREWDAIRASKMLKIAWSKGKDVFPEPERIYDFIRNATLTKRDVTSDKGAVDAAFASAARVVEAEYEWPFQSHASMGGACALADVRPDGVTCWTGTQKPHYAAQGVAHILGIPVEKVHAIWVTGPGSYGRNDAGDALMDAAVLSQAVGKPVRVQYMRDEGTGWDAKAPPSVHTARAAIDANGRMVAFEFTSKAFSRVDTASNESQPKDTLAGQLLGMKGEREINFGSPQYAYEFDNERVAWETIPTLLPTASPLRTTHMRDPVGPQLHFASESFIDEVAAAVKADPVAFRLGYIKSPRDIAVIKAAAEKAGWKAGPAGTVRRGRNGKAMTGSGIAYVQRTGTLVAAVADVEVDADTGRIWVRRVTVAHDCGQIINPRALHNVIEGNVVQGISRAIHEEVRFNRRAVTSVDWITYPILDITEAPEAVNIVLLDHPEIGPTGAGEPSTRPIAAAINNAVFDATGVRLRRAPLTPERVKAALTSRV